MTKEELYAKLAEVVQGLSDLYPDEDGETSVPVSWALVVGYDNFEAGTLANAGGATGIYPKDGYQASWKTIGLLQTALGRLQ